MAISGDDAYVTEKSGMVFDLLKDATPEEYHAVLRAAAFKRPWRPRRNGWPNVLDQIAHAVYGALLLLPVILFHNYWGAALMGLLAGGLRELEQYRNQDLKIRMIGDRLLDTSAFVVGAVLIFHFLH